MIYIMSNTSAGQKRTIYQLPNGDYLCRSKNGTNSYEFTVKYFADAMDFVEYVENEQYNNEDMENEKYYL